MLSTFNCQHLSQSKLLGPRYIIIIIIGLIAQHIDNGGGLIHGRFINIYLFYEIIIIPLLYGNSYLVQVNLRGKHRIINQLLWAVVSPADHENQ